VRIGRRRLLGAAIASAVAPITGVDATAPSWLPLRGVALSEWLQDEKRQPITAADLASIARAGFDHARLPIDPFVYGWRFAPELPALLMADVDRAIDWADTAGLKLILDLHPTAEDATRFEDEGVARATFPRLWAWLARRYAGRLPDRLSFELLNEPQTYKDGVATGARRWNRLFRDTVAAIRAVDRDRPLLVAGPVGSEIEHLDRLDILPDPRIGWVFHFYTPHALTHWGAYWGDWPKEPLAALSDLTYPAAAMRGTRPPAGPQQARVRAALTDYVKADWSRDVLARRIKPAIDWARRHRVALACTEFGILGIRHRPETRAAWLGDVRAILEAGGVGWTAWDYCDMFALARPSPPHDRAHDGTPIPRPGQPPRRQFDPALTTALGLPG
jgi:endoglucanase